MCHRVAYHGASDNRMVLLSEVEVWARYLLHATPRVSVCVADLNGIIVARWENSKRNPLVNQGVRRIWNSEEVRKHLECAVTQTDLPPEQVKPFNLLEFVGKHISFHRCLAL